MENLGSLQYEHESLARDSPSARFVADGRFRTASAAVAHQPAGDRHRTGLVGLADRLRRDPHGSVAVLSWVPALMLRNASPLTRRGSRVDADLDRLLTEVVRRRR